MENNESFSDIKLTLEDESSMEPGSPELRVPALNAGDDPVVAELSDGEKRQIEAFSKKIDIMNANQVLKYGLQAQKKISDFSENALKRIMAKDMGEVGELLAGLSTQLRGFTQEEEQRKGIFGFFKKSVDYVQLMRSRYESVEANLGRIVGMLEEHKIQLMKDISMLDEMYKMNLEYYRELTMYIAAGKERLKKAREEELPAMRARAEAGTSPQDARILKDFEDMCERFDKKLHDLELTRAISMQMGPQIRMTQNNDSVIVEKIQTSLINTIPLWKNNMVLAFGLSNAQKALDAQKAVTDVTNELLRKNADMLRESSVQIAKESERSIVDIETVKYANQQLLATIDEVLSAQETSRENRRKAEAELQVIENDLKKKLIQSRDR